MQILIGYFSGISLRHIYLMVPDGFQWAPIVLMVADGRLWSNTIEFRKKLILHTDSLIDKGTHPDLTKARICLVGLDTLIFFVTGLHIWYSQKI